MWQKEMHTYVYIHNGYCCPVLCVRMMCLDDEGRHFNLVEISEGVVFTEHSVDIQNLLVANNNSDGTSWFMNYLYLHKCMCLT